MSNNNASARHHGAQNGVAPRRRSTPTPSEPNALVGWAKAQRAVPTLHGYRSFSSPRGLRFA